MNLRTAFDLVDRSKLLAAMRGRGVREGLIRRCDNMLVEVCFKVRVRELGDKFCTGKKVRQECSLSPLLFNLLVTDLEEKLRRGMGRNKIERGQSILTGLCGQCSTNGRG